MHPWIFKRTNLHTKIFRFFLRGSLSWLFVCLSENLLICSFIWPLLACESQKKTFMEDNSALRTKKTLGWKRAILANSLTFFVNSQISLLFQKSNFFSVSIRSQISSVFQSQISSLSQKSIFFCYFLLQKSNFFAISEVKFLLYFRILISSVYQKSNFFGISEFKFLRYFRSQIYSLFQKSNSFVIFSEVKFFRYFRKQIISLFQKSNFFVISAIKFLRYLRNQIFSLFQKSNFVVISEVSIFLVTSEIKMCLLFQKSN